MRVPSSHTVMSLEVVDHALHDLTVQRDRMRDALAELAQHPGHQLLDGAQLTGETRDRWAATPAVMARLLDWFDQLCRVLDQAAALRQQARPDRGQLVALTALLADPVVELAAPAVPLEERSFTSPAGTVERCTLSEAVTRMKTTYREVAAVVATAHRVWSDMVGHLDAVEQRLRTARAQAATLTATAAPPELGQVGAELARLREQAFTDPLGLAGPDGDLHPDTVGKLRDMTGRLDAAAGRLGELARLRGEADDRLRDLATLIGRAAAADERARRAYLAALDKILRPALPPLASGATHLRDRLDGLDQLRRGGDWEGLSDGLTRLETDAAGALRQHETAARAADQLVARREELRGRLAALGAMARNLGHGGDAELRGQQEAARALLWTKPCDLAAATQAVVAYQRSVYRRDQGDVTGENGEES